MLSAHVVPRADYKILLFSSLVGCQVLVAYTWYKKLSYRRGTARRSMLVNSGYVSRAMVSNSKSDLQCHSRPSRALAM